MNKKANGKYRHPSNTITVTNANEAPTDVTLDNNTVVENAAGAVIGAGFQTLRRHGKRLRRLPGKQ